MMLTALADVARKAGLTVVEVAGWQTRNYGQMIDVQTVICHHTGGPAAGGNYPSLGTVRDGRSDLPGPLAQLGLGRDGTVYVIAAGLANHAGVSRDPSYTNAHSIGIEAENNGTQPWPDAQMHAYVVLCRALIDHYRLPVSRVLGHKETCAPVGRKVDPNLSMEALRSAVAFAGAKATQPPEDDMAITDADIDRIVEKIMAYPIATVDESQATKANPKGERTYTFAVLAARLIRLLGISHSNLPLK